MKSAMNQHQLLRKLEMNESGEGGGEDDSPPNDADGGSSRSASASSASLFHRLELQHQPPSHIPNSSNGGGTANAFSDDPELSCAADAVYAKWKTVSRFNGHLSVRRVRNRFCYWFLVTVNQIELLVPHVDCSSAFTRKRTPSGLEMSLQVVIDFADERTPTRQFTLVCNYTTNAPDRSEFSRKRREKTLIVLHNSNVSSPTVVNGFAITPPTNVVDFSSPKQNDYNFHHKTRDEAWKRNSSDLLSNQCSYTVFMEKGSDFRRPVAEKEKLPVGTQLVHEWWCSGDERESEQTANAAFATAAKLPHPPPHPHQLHRCLFVSDCLLNTGTGVVQVIDKRGCPNDVELVPPLDYQNNNTTVTRRMEIFSEVENPFLYFNCKLELLSARECEHRIPTPSMCQIIEKTMMR